MSAASGTTLAYSTYLGGSGTDVANGVALDALGNAYVVGSTSSTNFPTSGTAAQSSNAGGTDAFLTKILPEPAAPVFTGISPDTGSSSSDQITSSQNLYLSGTAEPGATVTVARSDLGSLGSVTADATTGDWTYNYTGVTLAAGTYHFTATQTAHGHKSAPSAAFPVTVVTAPPSVSVSVPPTESLAPVVDVSASDPAGLPANAAVVLDVDLHNDGSFTEPGDTNYASGTLNNTTIGTNGTAAITLPDLPGPGTYRVRARLDDVAGLAGASAAVTFTIVDPSTPSIVWAGSLQSDPLQGNASMQLGNVQIMHPLDLDESPGTEQSGNMQLVYNSDSLTMPVVEVQIQTSNTEALPPSITATLTWNGNDTIGWGAGATYSTSGFSEGDLLTMALQVNSSQDGEEPDYDWDGTSGRHDWKLDISLNYATPVTFTTLGASYVDFQGHSSFGSGWTLSDVNRLVTVTSDALGNPAGVLMLYGTGGYRFFAQGGSDFTSPDNDNGTLTFAGSGYVYTLPDGETTTFDSSGNETEWSSADGQQTLVFGYSGGAIASVTNIDGSEATFDYSSGVLDQITAPNGRVTTLGSTVMTSWSLLNSITNPDGNTETYYYQEDNSPFLLQDEFGSVNSYAYTDGFLSDYEVGDHDLAYLSPAVNQGIGSFAVGTVTVDTIDPLGYTTQSVLDQDGGRITKQTAADGGVTNWTIDDTDGQVTAVIDPLGRTTDYAYDSDLYLTEQTNPDGSTVNNAYQTLDHALTSTTDADGNTTTDTYDSAGHLTSTTNGLGKTTAFAYNGSGLLTSTTDPLGNTTTFGYDSYRRLTSQTDALGDTIGYTYDANGNLSTTTDPLGKVTTTHYDVMSWLTASIDPLGNTTDYAYNENGWMTSETDPNGVETEWEYDSGDQVEETTEAVGTGVQRSTSTEYDQAGNVHESSDAMGNETDYGYDSVGRLTSVTTSTGGNFYTTTTMYDLAGQATETIDPLGLVSTQAYNLRGWVTSSSDPLGDTTSYGYDPDGNQTSVTDPDGHTSYTDYDAAGRVSETIDGDGHATTTAYDADGNVTAVTNGDGFVTSYAFDAAGRQTVETDAVGTAAQATMSTHYDPDGNATETVDGDGGASYAHFDADGHVTETIDPDGHTAYSDYDPDGNVTETVDGLGHPSYSVYDALDRATAATDADGHTTTYEFDADDNPVATIDPLGHDTGTAYDDLNRFLGTTQPSGYGTYNSYNADYVTTQSDPFGNVTDFSYDLAGRQTSATDPLGQTSYTHYDHDGHATETIDGDGNAAYAYFDADGQVTETVDAAGHAAYTHFDADGNITETVDAYSHAAYTYFDGAGRVTETLDADSHPQYTYYDADGNVTETADGYGHTNLSYYDPDGNVTETIDPNSKTTYYGYDLDSRQTSVTEPSGQTAYTDYDAAGNATETIDYAGNTSYSAYDAANRQTSTTDGGSHTAYTYYDVDSNVTKTTDANAQSTTFAFDRMDQQTAMTDPLTHTSRTNYDPDGNVTSTSDGASDSIDTSYDADGRATSQLDADGTTLTTTYDGDGNTLTVTDSDSNETQYEYDLDGRQTLTIAPNLTRTTTTYDYAGNVSTVVDGDNRTTTFSYDDNNRELGETWKNSGGTITDVLTFTYDNAGNMKTAANSAGTDSFGYNADEQTSSQTDVFGLTTTYLYDGNGSVTQRTDSLGGTTTSVYDANENLKTEEFSGSGQSPVRADLTYTLDNELSSITRYDSLTAVSGNVVGTTAYGYDNADRVTAITTKDSTSTTLAYYDYAYDSANRITVLTTLSGGAETFTYDNASQLLSDHLNGLAPTTYTYDNNGNRNMSGYATTTGNETTNDGTYTYTYDNVGDMTEQAAAAGHTVMYYTYNQKNQVTSIRVTSDGSTNVSWTTFTYDALNRRVEQDTWQTGVGNSTTRMAYDINGAVWADLNGSNALQTRYIMGVGLQQYFAREDSSGNVYWLVQDTNYTVRDILNSAGADVDSIEYTAYGNVVMQTGLAYNGLILYDAYRYYAGANIDLTGQRVYSPADGKFWQMDPIMFGGGLPNLSDYCGNNPTNATDPSGLDPVQDKNDLVNRIMTDQILTDKEKRGVLFWKGETIDELQGIYDAARRLHLKALNKEVDQAVATPGKFDEGTVRVTKYQLLEGLPDVIAKYKAGMLSLRQFMGALGKTSDFSQPVTLDKKEAAALKTLGDNTYYAAIRYGLDVQFTADLNKGVNNRYFWSQIVAVHGGSDNAAFSKKFINTHPEEWDGSYEVKTVKRAPSSLEMMDTPSLNLFFPVTPKEANGEMTFTQPKDGAVEFAKFKNQFNQFNGSYEMLFTTQLRRLKPDFTNPGVSQTAFAFVQASGLGTLAPNPLGGMTSGLGGVANLNALLDTVSEAVGQYTWGYKITSNPITVTAIPPTWQRLK